MSINHTGINYCFESENDKKYSCDDLSARKYKYKRSMAQTLMWLISFRFNTGDYQITRYLTRVTSLVTDVRTI